MDRKVKIVTSRDDDSGQRSGASSERASAASEQPGRGRSKCKGEIRKIATMKIPFRKGQTPRNSVQCR